MKFHLVHQQARSRAVAAVMAAPEGYEVQVKPPTRNLIQNAKLWAVLTDLATQVDWHGNRLAAEEWKDLLTAGLKRQKVVPGTDGGFVAIGARTSQMSKADMSELIECAIAFGAQRGVVWSDKEYQEVVG